MIRPEKRIARKLIDIRTAIADIDSALAGFDLAGLEQDRIRIAALERFIEKISEASRGIPDELKQQHPTIPWRNIADIGNVLRHLYGRVEIDVLWRIYQEELPRLDQVVEHLAIEIDRRLGS